MKKEDIDCIIFHLWLEENSLLDEWFDNIEQEVNRK